MFSERRISDIRTVVSGLYTLGETIGTGHFAVVKLARHIFTQKEVAVKVIDKTKLDDISKAHLFQEVMCMKLVQHPNVVRLYEVIDTPTKLYLILELADGGDMYDYIMKYANGLNETLARRYFRQICRALKFCHELNVCHRDLKPENLVFFEKQGVVKLTDFGFSNKFLPGKKLLTSCGSLAYSAPEILLGDPYDAPAVDIWSLGVILFMLVTGRAPFQEANDSETVMMILDCSYKLPPNVSSECQNLIHRMIVRDPEKRATLDEVMSDIWYRQYDDDDDMESSRPITDNEHKLILTQMINGNIAEQEAIIKALKEDQYNHITATYNLLAEKILYDNQERNQKRQKRSLQPASDPFTEQIGVFIPSSTNVIFTDKSLPTTRQNSLDDDLDDFYGKENISPLLTTPRHSIDLSTDQVLSAVVEDDEEQPTPQQRTANPTTPATPAQAMKIILEEDECSESPPTDKDNVTLLPKPLNKIVESEGEDTKSLTPSTTVTDNSTTTASGVLRSKDLRSVIETKRRNFSRSCSSSDSEDNGSNYDITRSSRLKKNRSPISFQDSESLNNQRERSFSNIEHVLNENPQQQLISINNPEYLKRRSFSSRASSIISANRLALANTNDDTDTSGANSFILINDRTRSLSVDHRLTNQSQISIASRFSVRYATPRESTVFTKTEAPPVIRLLQQTHPHDASEAIRTIIEQQQQQQRIRSKSLVQEHHQPSIIVEETMPSPLTSKRSLKSPLGKRISNGITKSNVIAPTIETNNKGNGHISPSSQPCVLSRLKYSLIKHQHQRKSDNDKISNENKKEKQSTNKNRACCTIS